MPLGLFSRLRKYAHSEISAVENYTTEAFSALLAEFPTYRTYILKDVFHVDVAHDATVHTQVSYPTTRFGSAILDLIIEDDTRFVMIEIKVEADLAQYWQNGQFVDQLRKYEDCVGLPEEKSKSLHTLSKYFVDVADHKWRYFNPEANRHRWFEVYRTSRRYAAGLPVSAAEEYLVRQLAHYLEEVGMAGFQGFGINDVAALAARERINETLDEMAEAIKEVVKIQGFKPVLSNEWGRYGIEYEWEKDKNIKIFLGLWLSDETYSQKFRLDSGPQVMAFVEIPPKHQMRSKLSLSRSFMALSKTFPHRGDDHHFQLLLRHQSLADFLSSDDQPAALLGYYKNAAKDILDSGLLEDLGSLA